MWFVIHVKPGCETQAVNLLSSTSKSDALEEVFCPMVACLRKNHGNVTEAYEPMFAGCIFAIAPSKWELRTCMQKAPELEVLYSQKPSHDAMKPGEEDFINQWAPAPERVCAQSEAEVDEIGAMTIMAGPLLGHEQEITKYSTGRRWAYLDTRIAGLPVRAHVGVRVTANPEGNKHER